MGQGTPVLLSAVQWDDALFPADIEGYDWNCAAKTVRITVHLTTATGFIKKSATEDYTAPFLRLGACGVYGVGAGWTSGCWVENAYVFTAASPASGNRIGASCGAFVMDTAGAKPFDPATVPPPYSGTYQWTIRTEKWRLRSLEFQLGSGTSHPPDTILECARIDITTERLP